MRRFFKIFPVVSLAGVVTFLATALPPHLALCLEPVQRIVTPGGVAALLIESHQVGIISLRVSFRGGAMQEPAGKEGIAHFASYMFDEGTGSLTANVLKRRLERIGANFSSDAGRESIDITFATPSAHADEAFGYLKLAFQQPRYDAELLNQARRHAFATLAEEKVDPYHLAFSSLNKNLYNGTRFALPPNGTAESVAAITLDDVRAYRKRLFTRDNLRVAVAGDIDPTRLPILLDDLFSSLPAKAEFLPEAPIVHLEPSQHAIPFDLPQTIVVFANAVPPLNARQDLAAKLFNQVLNATDTGRLFMLLREREGLVYSVQIDRTRTSQQETFFGVFGAAPRNTERAKSLIMGEINRLATEGPSHRELEDAKSSFRGSYLLALDTSANLSATLLAMLKKNLPKTYLRDFNDDVSNISIDEVRAVGRLIARPDKMTIVTVGSAP